MKLFIDCEWNDYHGDLISMALVDEQGQYFYEVLPCDNPTPWIQIHVIPLLNKKPISHKVFTKKLDQFLQGYDSITVIADWPQDIALFCQALLVDGLSKIGPPSMTFRVERDLFDATSATPHNALADAQGLRDYYFQHLSKKQPTS